MACPPTPLDTTFRFSPYNPCPDPEKERKAHQDIWGTHLCPISRINDSELTQTFFENSRVPFSEGWSLMSMLHKLRPTIMEADINTLVNQATVGAKTAWLKISNEGVPQCCTHFCEHCEYWQNRPSPNCFAPSQSAKEFNF